MLVATLHDTSYARGAFISLARLHANADGTFLVGAGAGGAELFVADRKGAITRQIGRIGSGPHEFRDVRPVSETPTSYLIHDGRLQRMTYLSKATFEAQSVSKVPGDGGILPRAFSDGSYVFAGDVATRAAAGYGAHIVARDGQVLHSFGSPADLRAIALSGDSAVWLGYNNYRLELWSRTGKLLRVFRRSADWVRPSTPRTEAGDVFTSLLGLYEDDRGRLWVYLSRRESAGGSRFVEDSPQNGGIVEVLHPVNGTVLAQNTLRLRAVPIPGPAMFLRVARETTAGFKLYDVYAMRLTP